MARILTVLSLIMALILFPPAVLALVSNSAVPGDSTYPIKRKLEDGILLIASISPQTKAWFSVERSQRRFKEAAVLLNKGEQASTTLTELVDQTSTAARDVTQITDVVKKQELINQLSQSIKQYNQGLSQAAGLPAQIAAEPEPSQPTPTPAAGLAFSRSTPTPSPTPSSSIAPKTTAPVASPPIITTPAVQPITPSYNKQQEVEKTKQELDKVSKFLDEESKKLKEQEKNWPGNHSQETKKEEAPKVEDKTPTQDLLKKKEQ